MLRNQARGDGSRQGRRSLESRRGAEGFRMYWFFEKPLLEHSNSRGFRMPYALRAGIELVVRGRGCEVWLVDCVLGCLWEGVEAAQKARTRLTEVCRARKEASFHAWPSRWHVQARVRTCFPFAFGIHLRTAFTIGDVEDGLLDHFMAL